MNSLKTTCVILVLAGVLYGVYVTLNDPGKTGSNANSQPLAAMQPPEIDFSGGAAYAPPPTGGNTLPPFTPPAPPRNSSPSVDKIPPFSPEEGSGHDGRSLSAFEPVPFPPTPLPETKPRSDYPSQPAPAPFTPEPEPPAPAPLPPAPERSPALEAYKLKRSWQSVEVLVRDGKYREALAELSPFASSSSLTTPERQQLFSWLDALAGKVIYGPEHLLADPYRVVGKNQTLYEVAALYRVDSQLLLNINAANVRDTTVLVAGTELKVIPGPFRAELSLTGGELTLYVGPLYAGRFAFTVGEERPQPGTYQVREKSRDHAYVGRDGREIAANDPANPYGGWWIDLGKGGSLHGSGAPSAQSPALGCISFSPQDAHDLSGILSVSSEVVIKP